MKYEPMKPYQENGLLALFISAFIFVGWAMMFQGCTYKQGYHKGYAKAQEFYDTANKPDGKIIMPMYPYGFMRGWEYYKMEKARDAKYK